MKRSETFDKLIRDTMPELLENTTHLQKVYDIVYDDDRIVFAEEVRSQNKVNEFGLFLQKMIWKSEEKIVKVEDMGLLFDRVWYDYEICTTVAQVKKYKKYYRSDELICTFNAIKDRLSHYHIVWIVKKDIASIEHQWEKRNRQDEYGTSCCSIQINKNNWNISIKNRYNHKVTNCDATFSNNLDNIAEWLNGAISNYFWITIKKNSNFELDNFLYTDWKFIYYNYEINNTYYGINKTIKNNVVTCYDTSRYIILDYYIIDLKEKTVASDTEDAFCRSYNKIIVTKKDIENEDPNVLVIVKQ